MNWLKKAQIALMQQYQQMLENKASSIKITGRGLSETIQVPGSNQPIQARQILENVKRRILPLLLEKGVTEIDTNPIQKANAQGLAISSSPGIIYVDVPKIFNAVKQNLPSTVQMDGISADPQATQSIVLQIAQIIEAEITETSAHEGQHMSDMFNSFRAGKPFESSESGAQQYGVQIRNRNFPATNLVDHGQGTFLNPNNM